jgi:cytochrome c-type biogenesis protein CcsB
MTDAEKILFWLTLFSYALSFTLYMTTLVMKIDRHAGKAYAFLLTGFLAETATIAVRWRATGHVPTIGNYEYALAGTWLIILMTLWMVTRHRNLQYGALMTIAGSLLFLGSGYSSNPTLRPLSVALVSNWLLIHIIFSWLGFAAYVVACGMGALYLIKVSREPRPGSILERLPDADALEDMMFKYVIFGFINHFLSITTGAIWAKDLWGGYWSWDPVETWSLVSWMMYGLIIHLRVSLKWSGKRLAWMTVLAIAGILISWLGINFVVEGSQHLFNVR